MAGPAWAVVAAAVVVGLTSGVVGVLTSALVQARTDDAYRGRVGSVSSFANLGITPIAMALVGLAAGRIGTTSAFAAGGGLELPDRGIRHLGSMVENLWNRWSRGGGSCPAC